MPPATRPRNWTLCRALVVTYGLASLPLLVAMIAALPVAWFLVGRRSPGADPWWPATRWAVYAGTFPRLGAWAERRFCRR